jgi:hypothetical protein
MWPTWTEWNDVTRSSGSIFKRSAANDEILQVPSVMILPASNFSVRTIMLTNMDFPNNFVDMKYPDDYIPVADPTLQECTVHSCDTYLRLIMRISWKIDGGFLPMSFILDTGAMSDVFLSKEGLAAFEKYKLVRRDGLDNRFAPLRFGKKNDQQMKCLIQTTPENFEPANLIGLKLLLRLGLHLNKSSFEFDHLSKQEAWF